MGTRFDAMPAVANKNNVELQDMSCADCDATDGHRLTHSHTFNRSNYWHNCGLTCADSDQTSLIQSVNRLIR